MRVFRCIVVFCLLLPLMAVADTRQEQAQQRWQVLSALLDETEAQMQQWMEPIDDAPAQEWLRASGLARAQARLAEEPAEEERQLWQEILRQEQAGHERIDGALERLALVRSYPERLQHTADQFKSLKDELARIQSHTLQRSLSDIDAEMVRFRAHLNQLTSTQDQRQQLLQRLEEQQRTHHETLEQLRRQQAELVVAEPNSDDPLMRQAQEQRQLTQQRLQAARLISAQLDQQTLQPRIHLLRLELRGLEFERQQLHGLLELLEAEFNTRSTEELRQLSQALQALIERDPGAESRFADEIAQMRRQMDRVSLLAEQTRQRQAERTELTQAERQLEQTRAGIRERLDVGGMTEALGVQFLDEQKRLQTFADSRFRLRELERELTQSRLRVIGLRDDLRLLSDRSPLLEQDSTGYQVQRIAQQVLSSLIQAEEQYAEQVRQTELRLRSVAELVAELQQTLSESLLWWPSHTPVNQEWLRQVPRAVGMLFSRQAWQGLTEAFHALTLGSPFSTALVLLLTGLLAYWGRQTPVHLRQLAEQCSHRYTDNIGLTWKAIGWSLLRVLPVPFLLLTTALRLQQVANAGPGAEVLASVLHSAAIWWLAAHLFLLFTCENGVGRAHFEWNTLILQRLRVHLAWFMPVQLLLVILSALTFGHPEELVYDLFGRVALVLILFFNVVFSFRVLAPADEQHGVFFVSPRRRLLRWLLCGLFSAMLLLVLAGYLLTISELLPRVVDTVMMLALVWVAYCIAARMLILSETHLRIRRMREQRSRAESADEVSGVGMEGMELPDPHLSIEHINLQTRTLLNTATGTAVLIALFWVWSGVLPALTWLDGVDLWSRSLVIGDSEVISRVSLQDLLLALLLGVLFAMAARNLPGLVEILLARSKLMDSAHSYTITTLLRYFLAVVAVITVFSLLGLRWSELQWMVAALTLGLGFGLQEVVANFVSGLIMLFERPVRVGDTITIGEYSGTVSRIRTRATTIVDWDNREVVIPNKNFITERLINWTLSDNITRIVIPVGVSYASDPEQVMEILLRIANEHELTLEDPAPSVYFLHFADSALNFELRVYVCQMADRLKTNSELHVRILRAFRQAGIEIAFPQMDIHLRDVPRELGYRGQGG